MRAQGIFVLLLWLLFFFNFFLCEDAAAKLVPYSTFSQCIEVLLESATLELALPCAGFTSACFTLHLMFISVSLDLLVDEDKIKFP